ncbi:MAG: rRNA maturation RNase YbeY [Planctomycetota bacterium]
MDVSVCNQQTRLAVDEQLLVAAARGVAAEAGYRDGQLSIAVVDDRTIHELNRRHLDHDYPTDVLSFLLEDDGDRLEGEVIVSADTAITNAADAGWPAGNELLLYVVHGTLHLVGFRDKTDDERHEMREAEARRLAAHGLELPIQEHGALKS